MPKLLLIIAYLFGSLDALLCARLLLRLFAARPDNPFFRTLFDATAPLVAPLSFLDTGQPRFGAVLEFSTLVCILLLILVGLAVGWLMKRRAVTARGA